MTGISVFTTFRSVLLPATIVMAACGPTPPSRPQPAEDATRSAAYALVDSALLVLQQHAMNGGEVDWPSVRDTARARVARAQGDPMDAARLAIRYALSALHDHHSVMMFPSVTPRYAKLGAPTSDPVIRFLPPRFGYVSIPAYFGGSPDVEYGYANQYQRRLAAVRAAGACAWVVDLRGNVGGNMWPMLLGIGPVLGDGIAGAYAERDSLMPWSYVHGIVQLGSDTMGRVVSPVVLRSLPPVAVLTSGLTASSGEALTVSFRGRPLSRSFGEGTGGLSTGNQGYTLPDGTRLILTVGEAVDRTGRHYGGPIAPDVPLPDSLALPLALAWLATQPCDTLP